MSQYYEPYRPPVPVPHPPVRLTDQQQVSTALVVTAWILTVLTGLYLLPWAIAASRGKSNQVAVFVVNFLLGWTLVGWIVALVMSVTAHRTVGVLAGTPVPLAVLPPSSPPAGWYPNPSGPGNRYWDGTRWTESIA